jgi:hypothetical protein
MKPSRSVSHCLNDCMRTWKSRKSPRHTEQAWLQAHVPAHRLVDALGRRRIESVGPSATPVRSMEVAHPTSSN